MAWAIHRASPRRDRPFLTVDCGALVESLCESELFGHVKGAFTGAINARAGRFELADGGTIFLDEIGHVGPAMQGKLLRVLQEREITRVGDHEPIRIDVRIIAATNQDLRAAMFGGQFREDLFYRLSVVVIEIPPLRTHREDVPILAAELLQRLCARKRVPGRRLSPEALRMMQIHSWPGNVRELENTLERTLVLASGPEIGAHDLYFVDSRRPPGAVGASEHGPLPAGGPPPDTPGPSSQTSLDSAGAPRSWHSDPAGEAEDLRLSTQEARHIRQVLQMTSWQHGRAAALLGIDRKTLWRKIKEYGLK